MSGTTTQTIGSLILLAQKYAGIIGVGQTPLAQDSNDALTILNNMLAAWNARRWDVYGLEDVSVTCNGSASYAVGTSQQFNTPRPDRIEYAYMRQNMAGGGQSVDYPLQLLSSYEDYARISVKGIKSFSGCVFYDAAYPIGHLYFWPNQNNTNFEYHILVKQPLGTFTSLTNALTLPPPYLDAVVFNLASRLRIMYGLQQNEALDAQARGALATVQASNVQVPRMQLPPELRGGGSGWYNFWSDNN
jgi:hypothetical protein